MSPAHHPSSHQVSRRELLGGAAAATASTTFSLRADAKKAGLPRPSLAASPPAGFVPYAAPGKIVRVSRGESLQPNKLWPRPDVARQVLERAMTELTGEADLVKAMGRFIHKDDVVAIKVNGIAGQHGASMATNKELVIPIVEAVVALGVSAKNVWVYDQFTYFLRGTRVTEEGLPPGVKTYTHNNGNATMDEIKVEGIGTKFTRYLTDATAVIDISTIKDHGLCGYTGMLKNMTHGSCINPQDFHGHHASPQIAHLYAQDVVKSRVRLCVSDGFKVMFEGGPVNGGPEHRVAHDSVYVSTDPVALDAIGAQLVDKLRVARGLRTLKGAGRDPSYIRVAAQLGLGVADLSAILLREINLSSRL